MQTWIESITHDWNLVSILAGLVGALAAHAVASRFQFNNGFRLVLAASGFAALFAAGQSALGQRSDDLKASRPDSVSTTAPKGLRARAGALIARVPRDLTLATARQEVISFAAGFTTPPLRRFAGVASDSTAHELAGFFADALLDLRKDSVACVSFLFGVMDANLPPELSTDLEGRHYELAGRIAKEGRDTPQVPVDSIVAIPLGKEMALGLWRRHGKRAEGMLKLMSDPANALSKPRQVCTAAIAVYSTIDAMPPSKGGRLMRYMLYRRRGERIRGSLSPETPVLERRAKSVVQR
jgi:hypothetical protein